MPFAPFRRLVLLCMAAVGLLFAFPAKAAESTAFVAAPLYPGEHIVLDGQLSHPAWQRAPVHADFVERAPELGAVPRQATSVQVLFDQTALYVGIQAQDPDPSQIRAPLVRHDGVNRTQDFVAVYIDAIGQRQSAQVFRVNAAGSTTDGMHTAVDDSEDASPDFDFDAAVARHANGYSVVLRIPFASLRYDTAGTPAWRMMVLRRVPREQFHQYTSVLIPRDAASFISVLQPLQGLVLPAQHQFLTLRPSLTVRTMSEHPPGQAAVRHNETEASLDLKWRIRSEWVVDGTWRPDFSQVALDVPQLTGNTRYAQILAEKRPFFLESSDLLRSPTESLYTRSFTQPRWGLRSTWRDQGLAGSAFAVDDRGGGLVWLPGAWATGAAEQPASRALAARAQYTRGDVQLGGLAVSRRYVDDRGDNQVVGPDLGWQVNPAWRLRAQWLQSSTTAQADAAGQLRRQAAQTGRRALLKVLYQGDNQDGSATLEDIDAGFRNDTGFVNQSGVRSVVLTHSRGRQQVGPFNEFWFNFHFDEVQDKATGLRVSSDPFVGLWMTAAHNLEASVELHADSTLRTAADAPLLHQHYLSTQISITPATWAPLLTLSGRIGRIADVAAQRVRTGGDVHLSLATRPAARLEFEPSWDMAWAQRDGQRTYRENALQVLAVWHFDARQSLRAIVQRKGMDRLAEPGVAAARDRSTLGSLTYAWRQSAGNVLYLGLNRSAMGLGQSVRSNEAFIKLQVDIDSVRTAF
jgi:hypothetical protein